MEKLLKTRVWQTIIAVMVGGILAVIPPANAGASSMSTTTLTTKGLTGTGASSDIHKSQARTLSADGRISVFSSTATNLTPGPHNGAEQVYAYDKITQKTELVSHTPTGEPGSGGSYVPTISADGRFVAYATTAPDIPPKIDGLCNGPAVPCVNIIVYDLVGKDSDIANVGSYSNWLPAIETGVGGQAPVITRDGKFVAFFIYHRNAHHAKGYRMVVRNIEEHSTDIIELTDVNNDQVIESALWDVTINDTGRFVAFQTDERLVRNDYHGQPDIYLFDRWTRRPTLVSGLPHFGVSSSTRPVISADGNFVVYESPATNLTSGGSKKVEVFLYNRIKDSTTLVSKSTKGAPAAGNSFAADISGDGQYVVYASYAPNLVRADTTDVDIFLYYTNFGATRLISRAAHNGVPGDNHSLAPSISQDGKVVTFLSKAHNLTNDAIPRNTLFSNSFLAFDPVRQIPYYDQTDLLDLLQGSSVFR